MTVYSKPKCGECQQSYSVNGNLNGKVCEKCETPLTIETFDVDDQKPKTQKSAKKSALNKEKVQRIEKTVPCEFEEVTITGEKNKHRYNCSYSEPNNISRLIETRKFSSFTKFRLNLEALKIKHTGKINKLIALDAIKTKLIPYNFQMQTALKVINDMNGNAILADEVGLGKTIESGLIMKELILREEINSILIVCPKSLLSQWKMEMAEKFEENFSIANSKRVNLRTADRIICSHNLLARKIEDFGSRTWDLIVVDEAHAFRNTHSKGRACLGKLGKNHFLLLTATPLCNRLTDLYSIVDLIQPGILDSERAFISRFAEDAKSRIVKPEEVYYLRQSLQRRNVPNAKRTNRHPIHKTMC